MGQDPAEPQRGLFVEVPGEGDRSSPRRGQDGPPRCGAGAEGWPPASPTACLYLWTSGRSPPPTLCPLRAPSPRRLTPQCWWWRRSWLTTGRSGRAGSPAGTGGSCRRGRWRSSAAPAWWLRGTGQAHVRPATSPESGLPGPRPARPRPLQRGKDGDGAATRACAARLTHTALSRLVSSQQRAQEQSEAGKVGPVGGSGWTF